MMERLIVSMFFLAISISACQQSDQAIFSDYQLALDKAVQAKDTEKVFELICPHRPMVMKYQEHEIELVERMRAFLHSRYESVFIPPANVDVMCGTLGWGNAFFLSQYNCDGVASVGGPPSTFYPEIEMDETDVKKRVQAYNATNWFLRIDKDADPFLQIDLEPDGIVDLSFDGDEFSAGPGSGGEIWIVEADESDDGTRKQWLAGPAASNLRKQPKLWLYRDGPIFFVFMDTDGDGKGNLGRGACIP